MKSVGTVSVATQPTAAAAPPAALPVAVAITPDGKRALVVKSGANRVGLLDIDGQKVSYAQVDGKNHDMATGLNPLNVQITPMAGSQSSTTSVAARTVKSTPSVSLTSRRARPV